MKSQNLRAFILMALCCDLGLFSKKLVAPAANIITEVLHIPGGIATGFSLMFLVIAAAIIPAFGCGTLMGVVQSVIALAMGMGGSMGILAPVGYILPGLAMDMVLLIFRKNSLDLSLGIMLSSVAASLTACFTANLIVFRLFGMPLLLYASVAACSGAIYGVLAVELVKRLKPVIVLERNRS